MASEPATPVAAVRTPRAQAGMTPILLVRGLGRARGIAAAAPPPHLSIDVPVGRRRSRAAPVLRRCVTLFACLLGFACHQPATAAVRTFADAAPVGATTERPIASACACPIGAEHHAPP